MSPASHSVVRIDHGHDQASPGHMVNFVLCKEEDGKEEEERLRGLPSVTQPVDPSRWR